MTQNEPDIYKNGHIDVAHPLAKKWAKYRLSGEEWQVLWVIIARTWGWHKPWDVISLKDFYQATEMKKPSIIRAINKLVSKHIVSKRANTKASKYHVNSHLDNWKSVSKKAKVSKKANGVSNKANGVSKRANLESPEPTSSNEQRVPKETLKRNTTKERKKEPSCRKLKLSDELFETCDKLRIKMEALILTNKPDYRFRGGKNRPKKWVEELGRMITIDHRSPERIGKVMKWALNHPFWRANILSPHKLRMQFDALELRMAENKEGSYGQGRGSSTGGAKRRGEESEKYRGVYT